jgi:hypothetical protein
MNLLRCLVKSGPRIFGLVFTTIMLVVVIQVVRQPRWYEAAGTLKCHRVMITGEREARPPAWDWNELRVALKSPELIRRVVGRLTEAEQSETVIIEQSIGETQRVSFDRLEGELAIEYRDQDRVMVARVVNLLLDEAISYQASKQIDESMKEVEELKLRAEAQARKVRGLTEEIMAYRDRSEKTTGKPFEVDADYEAMQQRLDKEQKKLDSVIHRMRDITMGFGMDTASWRLSKRAVPPDEDDYLVEPIVMRLSWGFTAAVVGGLLAVGLVDLFTRGRELADNPKEAS